MPLRQGRVPLDYRRPARSRRRRVVRAPLSNRQNCQRWTQQKQSVYHWGLCTGISIGAASVLSLRGQLTRRKRYGSLAPVRNSLCNSLLWKSEPRDSGRLSVNTPGQTGRKSSSPIAGGDSGGRNSRNKETQEFWRSRRQTVLADASATMNARNNTDYRQNSSNLRRCSPIIQISSLHNF